ncbi:hypothetical protein MMC16_002786 [Acarospora aff. strigata]|nr:hypothetical protein [Acarospora aff. strigata]
MRLYTLLTHSVLLPTLVLAHADGFGGPKIFGRNAIADLRKRNVFTGPLAAPLVKREPSPELGRRAEGYCGIGPDYCNGPDCQLDYGPGCDANKTPPGTNTSSIPRPALGSVLYGGAGIYQCTEPGTIAITYDDGPYIYTSYILDLLKSYSSKATFFITANNNGKGEIDDPNTAYPAMIRRMRTEGHQIASHTWTHQDLSKITPTQRKAQMIKAEMALRNILGFIPTYMRPPYSSCDFDSGCAADMKTLGYHITYFDVDTNDYNLAKPELIQGAKDNFVRGIKGNAATDDHLVIAHDIHQQTAYNLTQFMLGQLLAQGYKAVTVGQCLGDPQANWYRTASGAGSVSTATSSSASPSSTGSKPISRDATCGPATGFTCQGSSFG